MARHDKKRTATADSPSDLKKPVPYYRYYLGGALSPFALLTGDVDNNGSVDVVVSDGSRVIAKRLDDSLIWQTDSIGVFGLVGLADLDGDGKLDVVGYAAARVYVLSGVDGHVEWAEPITDLGTFSGVRVADLDGDGHPDLYIEESMCGAVNSGNPGFVYGFGQGFANVKQLWKVADRNRCGSIATLAVDVDGDGVFEIVGGAYSNFTLYDGKDGSVLGQTADLGPRGDTAHCIAANVDGKKGDEVVCLWNDNEGPNAGSRRIMVLHYDAPSKTFAPLWQHDLGDYDGGDADFEPSQVVDLDGDGTLEVIAGGQTAAGVWTTHIYDGTTGDDLGDIDGSPAGSAPVASPSTSLTFVTDAAGLTAYSFDVNQKPSVKKLWSLASDTTQTVIDPKKLPIWFSSRAIATLDLDGDGVRDLVTTSIDGAGVISVYSAKSGQPKKLATLTLPKGTLSSTLWIEPPLDRPYEQIVLSRTDGLLNPLDSALLPTNKGVQIGGYYSETIGFGYAPIAAAVDGTKNESVFVPDSRGALLRVDFAQSSLAVAPKPAWERLGSSAPAVVPGIANGGPAIVCRGVDQSQMATPTYHVAAVDPSGKDVWKVPTPSRALWDVIPGAFSNGQTNLFLQLAKDTNQHVRAIAAESGSTRWDAPQVSWYGTRPPALGDWDGDGVDDVFAAELLLKVHNGLDGNQLAASADQFDYMSMILQDVDGDKKDEVTLVGGINAARTLKSDLTTALWTGEEDRPLPYGAIATCNGASPVLVESSAKTPSRIKITTVSGGSAGNSTSRVLAGGKIYPDEASAIQGGAILGALGNTTIANGITGDPHATVLVPSTDGYLYGLDPCKLVLDFDYHFGSALGEAIVADTNGDGKAEILVTAADGYVYGLKQEAIPAPASVIDTDPDKGITDKDVDSIDTDTKLSGKWTAVPNAAGYQVALVGPDGQYVLSPPWQDVDKATTAVSIDKLTLVDGGRYIFAVRAVNAKKELSPDALSNGVTVHKKTPGTGGAGGTGGTGGMSASSSSSSGVGGATTSATTGGGAVASGDGCGCRVAGAPDSEGERALAALGALAALALVRRRRAL